MLISDALRHSWAGRNAAELLERLRHLELLERSYTLSAQTFVALFPLILVLAALVSGAGSSSVLAEDLIERFGLAGAAARSVRDLIVIRQEGVYWLGLIITVYSAFVLGRRVSRTYNLIWQTPRLPASQAWRSLIWIVIQVSMVAAVSQLRSVARDSGDVAAIALAVVIIVVWGGAEYVTQRLFTRGAVLPHRLAAAAVLVCIGRIGMVAWAGTFMASSLARQAESFGPIGVVFALFTLVLASWLVVLGATLLAAVLTEPRTDSPAPTVSVARAPAVRLHPDPRSADAGAPGGHTIG